MLRLVYFQTFLEIQNYWLLFHCKITITHVHMQHFGQNIMITYIADAIVTNVHVDQVNHFQRDAIFWDLRAQMEKYDQGLKQWPDLST